MKKKIGLLSLLLVLAMCLAFLPGLQTEAEAAAASSITVNGYDLPSGYYLPTATWTKTTTKPSGSYFYYSGGTLTIYNVTLTSPSGTRAVYAEGDLIVSLSGTNKLTTNNANGIRSAGTLKFTGTGSLTVSSSSSGSYDAIYSSGNMEFAQAGTVTATATGTSGSGVECAAKLTIGGNLNATSESSYAILASGDISMTKGTVNATGNCTYSAGGICSNGAITVSGGTLNVNSKSDGIISEYDFWQKAGNVTVNADWNGIVVESTTNNIIIHEGTMTVTAARSGLKAQKFYINGGHGYIKSTNTSYDSSYSAVELAGNSSTYFSMKGSVKAAGSTTTSSSSLGSLGSLSYANLSTYDYVYFTGYVTVNGVELRDGYYLQSGKTTTDTTKPSGGYAYYSGNTLTLNNYEGSNNSASGIYSRYDLNIVLAQGSTNKLTTSAASGTTYCGINVSGALNIRGLGQLNIVGGKYAIYSTGSMTLSSTQVIAIGGGIYSGSALNFKSASVGIYQLLSAASGTHAIQAAGNIDIDGAAGTVYINTPDKVNGNFVRGIVGKNITINSSVGITSSGVGIRGEGNVTINSGTVEVNAKLGSGIYAASTMKITGGTVDVTAYNNGLSANKLVITGGNITAVSTYTGNDAANKAIDVPDNTTASFQIPSNYAFLASEEATFSYNEGARYYLESYDWVHIGDFVMMHGVELRSGYYLASGNSANTPTLVRPSNGGYAYYADGVLTLYNYSYSGDNHVVKAYADLTVTMTGTNSLKATQNSGYYSAISTSGNLTINGDGSADVSSKPWHSIYAFGNITIVGVSMNVSGSDGGIYSGGTTTIFSGYTKVKVPGIGVGCNKLKISGGVLTVRSTGDSSDDYAIKIRSTDSDAYTIGSNMNSVYMSSSIMGTYSTFKQGCTTDSVALGNFILVNGVVVPRGYYLVKGSSTPVKTTTSSNYACVNDSKTLVLKNYSCSSGNDVPCVLTSLPLTIILDGSSTLNSEDDTIYAMSDLTIKCRNSDADELKMKSNVRENINCFGKLTMAGGTVSTNTGDCQVITTMNGMNITGGKLVLTDTLWIQEGDLTISGGEVNAKVDRSSGISVTNGDVTVTGGEVYVESKYDGLFIKRGKFSLTGGMLTAVSTNTDSDSSYYAIKLAKNTTDCYNVASTLSQAGTFANYKTAMNKLELSKLNTYDYVEIGDYVTVRGVTLPNGYSVNGSGNLVKGDGGSGYAYYKDGVLTLNNFLYNKSEYRGIDAYQDLTINVKGNCTLDTASRIPINVYGDVSLTGDGTLNLCATDLVMAVYGDMSVSGVELLGTTANGQGLYTSGTLTVTSGTVTFYAGQNGIMAGTIKVTGGELFARSSNTAEDSSYQAVQGSFSMAAGMYAAGTDSTSYAGAEKLDTSKLSSYDFVYVGDYVIVGGVLVTNSNYLGQGTTMPTPSTSATSWVRYTDGKLVVKGFSYTGTAERGIYAPHDLEIALSGNSTLSTGPNVAVYVDGDLTLGGTKGLKLTLTATTKEAIYTTGDILIEDITVTATSGDNAIYTTGNLTVDSGNLTATGTAAGTAAVYVKNLYLQGSTVNITGKYVGVYLSGTEMKVSSGSEVNITSSADDGIYTSTATVTMSGGTLNVTGKKNGIVAKAYNQTGGNMKVMSSAYSAQDADYQALKAGTVTLPSNYVKLASTEDSTLNIGNLDTSKLSTYDYIRVEPLEIKVNGIGMVDGWYLAEGSPYITNTKPTSGDYAYRSGNKLYLYGMTVTSAGAVGIESNGTFEIINSGTSKFSCGEYAPISAGMELVISGSGSLTLTANTTAITCRNYFSTTGVDLTLNSTKGYGIHAINGDVLINSGNVKVTSKLHAVDCYDFTVNGGTVLLQCSNYEAADSAYWALAASGDITISNGLAAWGALEANGSLPASADWTKRNTYDYVKIDKASTIVSGPLNGTVTGMQETANVNLALYKSGQAEPAYEAVRLGNGSFTFTFVEYGTYTLKATATGYQDFTTTVTVSGSTPSVTVTMTKKSSGNITVECVGDISYTVSGSVVKVTHDVACKVGYLSGSEYVAITPTKNSDGSYSFTAPAGVTNVLLVVKGDVNGDGKVTSSDYSRLNAVLLKKTTLTAKASFAANCNTDTQVTSSDYSRLNAVLLKKTTMAW